MDRSAKIMSRRAFLFGARAARNEDGATAIAYGLIAAIIAVALIPTLTKLGFSTNEKYRCTARVVGDKKIGRKCKKALNQ